jgi:hypothetical protein
VFVQSVLVTNLSFGFRIFGQASRIMQVVTAVAKRASTGRHKCPVHRENNRFINLLTTVVVTLAHGLIRVRSFAYQNVFLGAIILVRKGRCYNGPLNTTIIAPKN